MPPLRDFLGHFRPAGAPGAARAAVPADRRRQLEAELGPVLMLLDGPEAECARMVAEARRDAERVIAAARARASALESDAGRRAAAARSEAVREVLATARAEAARSVASAARQAALTRELARQRLPALARRAVALVRDLHDEDQDWPRAGRPSPPSRSGGES